MLGSGTNERGIISRLGTITLEQNQIRVEVLILLCVCGLVIMNWVWGRRSKWCWRYVPVLGR